MCNMVCPWPTAATQLYEIAFLHGHARLFPHRFGAAWQAQAHNGGTAADGNTRLGANYSPART